MKISVRNYFLLGLAVIVMAIFIVVLLAGAYVERNSANRAMYIANINVGDYVGFNVQTEKIYFGTVPRGGFSTREISLYSSKGGYLFISSDGAMADILKVSRYPNKIMPQTNITILLYALPDEKMKFGEYESTIFVYVLNSKNSFFEMFLPGRKIGFFSPEETEEHLAKVGLTIVNSSNSSSNVTSKILPAK